MTHRPVAALLVAWSLLTIGEPSAHRAIQITPPGACLDTGTPMAAPERQAQPACCQGRKGVCGCRAGKIVCCDRSFSESCSCHRDEAAGPRL